MRDPKILIGLAISAVCVWTVVHGIEWAAVGDALRRTNLLLTLPALGFLALVFLLRALRWQRLVAPIMVLPLRPFWSASLIGFMANDILPLRLGEVVRGYALAHLTAVSVSTALATSLLERVWDTVTVGIVALFTASQFPLPPWVARTNWTVLLVSVMLLIAGVWLARQEQRQLPWLPARFAVVAERFLSGFRSLQSFSALAWVIGLSFAIWFALVGYYWVLLHACGFTLPFSAALLVMVFTVIAAAVPAAPGFVGTFQYAVVLALSFFSVPKAEALGFSIIAHLMQLIPVIIAGLIALVRARLPLWPSRLVVSGGVAVARPNEPRVEVEGVSSGGAV